MIDSKFSVRFPTLTFRQSFKFVLLFIAKILLKPEIIIKMLTNRQTDRLKNIPFLLFLAFLTIIYIANAHYSIKKIRQIQALQKDVKELRWNYMSLKSELMYDIKRVEMMKDVKSMGLTSSNKKKKRIIVPKRP